MEVLKLLTRSTSLQKKANNSSAGVIPSAGAPSHPQFLGEISHDGSRGTKRKRAEASQLSESNEITDLLAVRSNEKESVSPNHQPKSNIAPSQGTELYEQLSEDECKQILRSHKIKVSVFNRGSGAIDKVKAKKKKKRSKTQQASKEKVTPIYPQPLRSFRELRKYGVSRRIVDNILDQGFLTPTEVQLAALPMLLDKENNHAASGLPNRDQVDLLTVAPTGSGKTMAFLVPLMDDILLRKHSSPETEKATATAIILAPTHELVDQIVNEGRRLSVGTGVRVSALRKGISIAQDLAEEETGASTASFVRSDIIVGTPALIGNSLSNPDETRKELPRIRRLVLDEADVLLDPLFRDDTLKVWEACTNDSLRASLWSATMGASIESLATERMFDRSKKTSGSQRDRSEVVRIIAGLKDSAIPNVKHQLTYAASEQGKLLALRNLLHPSTASSAVALRPPFLVFTQTIARAIALHSELRYDISVEAGGSSRIAVLHSDLSLSARSDIMARFRKGEVWVLITTDLLSRGVDFRGVNGVVNYDIPNSSASYVHRAGRTGRAGRDGGVCVTLYTKEDIPYVKGVANVIAAAEKMKGGSSQKGDGGMPQWLLDALPDLSKEVRKELKEKGVAARRSTKGGKSEGGRSRMRISTKSGYERKLENRRRVSRTKRDAVDINEDHDDDESDRAGAGADQADIGSNDEFGGFDD